MRLTRLIIGLLLILVSIWVIVGEQISGASANAMVNARLATLRPPIAGRLTMPDLALGATVREGEELASITDSQVDRIRLNDLVLEWKYAQTERDRLREMVTETRQMMETLSVRAARFAGGKTREAEIRLRHAKARLALLEGQSEAGRDRVAALEPRILLDDLPGQILPDLPPIGPVLRDMPTDLALALETAREEVGVREAALEAARDGVFLGDGYNDSPYAGQRLSELQSRLDTLVADLGAQAQQVRALASRVTQARIGVNQRADASLVSPLDGRLWEILAGNGERVERGQNVLRLLDCGNLIVTASVSESVYNRLQPGDAAHFRLSGTGEVFEATVERLAGSGAAAIYRNLAVAPGPDHLQRFDVAVSVPGLPGSKAGHCPVGRTGRVFFDERPLDWLRELP